MQKIIAATWFKVLGSIGLGSALWFISAAPIISF